MYLVLGVVDDLHASHGVHLLEVEKQLLLVGGDSGGGSLAVCESGKSRNERLCQLPGEKINIEIAPTIASIIKIYT